ncbi:myelin-associated glycoprotein [Bombina bombina]|uniref:myelin-associated glycoprotein n=1 Tax=Bombina bombina TaxID=8345 RepID=UPI00235A8A84|nr:myelin-associated glycoprotein [Bombina bombina]
MDILGHLLLVALFQGFFLDLTKCSECKAYVPKKIRALHGSCVVIPCHFTCTEKQAHQNLTAIWFQDGSHRKQLFNSYDTNLVDTSFKNRTSLVGDMVDDNCTIIINNVVSSDENQYYVWIAPTQSPLQNMVYSDKIYLEVSSSPQTIYITNIGEMTEGINVKIHCSMKHTCPASPPFLKWNCSRNIIISRHEPLQDGEWKIYSSLQYNPRANDNGHKIQCLLTDHNVLVSSKSLDLNVIYPPKQVNITSTNEDSQVKEGEYVSLECHTYSNPAPTHYIWYKDNMMVLNHSQAILQIERMTEDEAGHYKCTAHNHLGEGISASLVITCVRNTSLLGYILGTLGGIIVINLLVLAVIFLSKQWKSKSVGEDKAGFACNTYMNMMSSVNPGVNEENPYTALDANSMCAPYEELKVGSAEYVEVFGSSLPS